MGVFGHLFGHRSEQVNPELLAAIDRAVSAVEPLLKQMSGYPDSYRKPVAAALEYARVLAASVPGPVTIDRESYAGDAYRSRAVPICRSYPGGVVRQPGDTGISARVSSRR